MASRSSSHSEGEIISSDSEKAKSLHSRNGTSIDRHTRPYASAPRSPATGLRRSRSRSRSPYRAPRGEKRRRDEGRSSDRGRGDTRRFGVRYEDDVGRDRHRTRGSYEDLDPGHTKRSYLYYDDDYDRRRHSKRPRTQSRSRSRSPFRLNQKPPSSTPSRRDHHIYKESKSRDIHQSRGDEMSRKSHTEQSVSERSTAPNVAQSSRTHAETGTNQASQDNAKTFDPASTAKSVLTSF